MIDNYLGWIRGATPETVRFGDHGQIWTRAEAEKAYSDEEPSRHRLRAIGQEVLNAIEALWTKEYADSKPVTIRVGDLRELLDCYTGETAGTGACDYELINRCHAALGCKDAD